MKIIAAILACLFAAASQRTVAGEPEWFTAIKAAYAAEVKKPKDQPPLPPVNARIPSADYDYGVMKFPWSGAGIVWDEVNGEALFLCGHNGGMPSGTMGSWALTDGGKMWRELQWASPVLDPLRANALAARLPAKDGEAAARGLFYAALDAAQEAQAAKSAPAKLIADATRLAEELSAALHASTARGWEKESIARAGALTARALGGLKSAHAALAGGRLDAEVLRQCFDAQWALDEAADCLATSPPPRENASVVFDPAGKSVVLFGGSHHDFMRNDTWRYDCAQKSWRQWWPKTAPTARMGAAFARGADGRLALTGGQTVLSKMTYQLGEMPAPAGEWMLDTTTGEWSGADGAEPGTRIYRTIVRGYDPRWYDAAPRGDRAATEEWLAQLPPNVWTAVPAQPAPAPEREWGTAAFDPDRDQIYRWTGGHCADPSTQVSTYHPAINRWSSPFVPDIIAARKGMTFTGRPDCANHTYLHYAYDPVSRRLICPSQGGTGVFNPDSGDFEFSVEQPFNRKIYQTCAAGTPLGVVLWTESGKMFVFDYAARAWKPFPLTGKPPRPVTDGSTMCYDARRDALWIASFLDYQKASGSIWRCDLKTGVVTAMNPAGAQTIGTAKGIHSEIRESVYIPTADLVLFNNFIAGGEVAYDPNANRWVTLGIPKKLERLGTVSDTLTWDPKRRLVWNLNSYKAIYVLKLDPKSLVISESPDR